MFIEESQKQSLPRFLPALLRALWYYVKLGARIPLAVVAVTALCLLKPAQALEFTPNEREWATWPDYCRARYVVSGAGMRSDFVNRIAPSEASKQERDLGDEVWYWLHHYCAGLVYLSRAASEIDKARADSWLREAEENIMGHYRRVSRDNPMFPEFIIGVARLQRQQGNDDAALRYLEQSIDSHPQTSSPYAFSAQILRENQRLDHALAILEKGNEALDGKSAEIHYFLAHIYIDLGRMDLAITHAKRAYELGYPLPGLALKLDRLGYSLL